MLEPLRSDFDKTIKEVCSRCNQSMNGVNTGANEEFALERCGTSDVVLHLLMTRSRHPWKLQ